MKRQVVPYVWFTIVGVLLVAISFLLIYLAGGNPSEAYKLWVGTFQLVGFAFLTVVIVGFAWSFLGGEPVENAVIGLGVTIQELRTAVVLLQESKETGLTRILALSGDLESHAWWTDRLQKTQKKIDLMGYSLHVWTKGERFEDLMVAQVKAGVDVRVLIMDETNPHLDALINEAQIRAISRNVVVEEIKVARKVFEEIASKVKSMGGNGSYALRTLKRGLVVTQICRTDSQLTAVQYLYSGVASRSPLLEVRGEESKLFGVFTNEFDRLWDLGS
jgi:hypothetical protein